MSRIQKRLTSLNGKKALVAFFTAGDPDLNASKDIFSTIETHGADIVEIGVPFSVSVLRNNHEIRLSIKPEALPGIS